MRNDFKFPPPLAWDSGVPDIELTEEDQSGVPVTPRTVPPPPMIVVHAAKDSTSTTPLSKRWTYQMSYFLIHLPRVLQASPYHLVEGVSDLGTAARTAKGDA